MRYATAAVGTLLLLLLLGCGWAEGAGTTPPNQDEEIARIMSPDSSVDAVVGRSSEGATTSFVYRVYLVPHGDALPARQFESFRADQVDGLSVSWSGRKRLDIRYKAARIFHFSNFWSHRYVSNFQHIVSLHLQPEDGSTTYEQSAPPRAAP